MVYRGWGWGLGWDFGKKGYSIPTVTRANHYCIMLPLADSLAATSIGANARHHQPDFRNQSDIVLGTNQISSFTRQTARVLLHACKKLPYWSDNFRWCALMGSKGRVIDLIQIPFEGAIRQRYVEKFLLR